MSSVGYNHPSQANWNWGIWKIDLINTNNDYCISYTVKEQFGGDSRFRKALESLGIKVIQSESLYTKTGTPKITGISNLMIMDDQENSQELLTAIRKELKI